MTHIHKKIRHHLTKHRAHIISFAGLLCAVIFLSGVFLLTQGSNPATSELAFTERSSVSTGSVIPASCESGIEHTAGECADVWWCDAQTLGSAWCTTDCCTTSSGGTKCGTKDCTTPPPPAECPWGYSGTPPNCTLICSYSYTSNSRSYNADGCSGTQTDYEIYSCPATGAAYVNSQSSSSFNDCVAPAPTCANGGLPADQCACDAENPANYFTDQCCQGTSGQRCGTITRTCANGGLSGPVDCPVDPCAGNTNCGECGNAACWVDPCGGNGYSNPPICGPTCDDPSADNYGAAGSCTYTPYPDLTAGAVSPISAVAGTAVTFSSTIRNTGDLSTGASFDNFMQVATAANGGGTVTDLAAVNMSTLASGASAVTSKAYTFASAGTYSVRACADKSNRNSSGVITEYGEGNNCGAWRSITVTANPTITNVSVNYDDITFVCNDATSYSVTYNETSTVIASGATVSGVTVTAPHDLEGNYTLKCIQGALSAQAIVNYTIPVLTYDGIFITSSPRTVNTNKNTTISWSVLNPKAACSLRAEVVCSGGHASCTQAQLTQETSLNTTLTTGTTDANDPYGASRNIQTAVKKVAPQNNPTGNKALGKKTLLMTYTTDIILDCGPTFIKKFRIITSDENEG